MGLPVPVLDDTTYEDLIERARDRIPVSSEVWTDHNVHDPGITILELLAWVTEADIYRLDRIPDAHRRQFLGLLGVVPELPKPATATLSVDPPAARGGVTVPAGTEFSVRATDEPTRYFRTTEPRTVTKASLAVVSSDHSAGRTDNTTANGTAGISYQAFGPDAAPGSTLYLGFDGDPFAGVSTLDLAVEFHEADLPKPADHGTERVAFSPTVELTWEHCTNYERWYSPESWSTVSVRSDTTTRFYYGGTVRLERPVGWTGKPATASDNVLDRDRPLFWLRCRVEEPADDGPGYEIPPQFDAIRLNRVPVSHERVVHDERLETPAGDAMTSFEQNQVFAFENAPILSTTDGEPSTVDLVLGPGDPSGVLDTPWTQVTDFAASGPDDKHFTVDHTEGTITFGDGVRGTIPAPGQYVTAIEYRHGGGREGNVTPDGRWRVESEDIDPTGVYRFASETDVERMRGAIIVGPLDGPRGAAVVEWLAPATGETTPMDARGQDTVRITVGTEDPAKPPQFSPAGVHVDPGTTVEFVWVSAGHTIDLVAMPPDATWTGVAETLQAGAAVTHTFEEPTDLTALDIAQVGRATGGRDAEPIDEALLRLQRDRQTVYRAVTADDYATLARATPGLRFGRTTAFVETAAGSDDCARHGRVHVIVVPFSTRERPRPSEGVIEAVRCHLERHRLVTDRFVVEPPQYVGIGVDVEVRLEPGTDATALTAAIDEELQTYLHPLDGYTGDGWPFGRPVYKAELYEVVESVDGVDCVLTLDVRSSGPTVRTEEGDIEIGPQTLVYSLDHSVTYRQPRPDCGPGGRR